MEDNIYLVTGANTGIGFETAKALAQGGGTVLMWCRNRERGEPALAAIREAAGHERVHLYTGDLGSQQQIRRTAAQISHDFARLDVLINNAGMWYGKRELTEDGHELVFAVNHLSFVLVTHLLYPNLRRSAAGRIINVASDSHYRGKIHVDDYSLTHNYHGLRSYEQSKLANVLFTYELDRRKPDEDICVQALGPGLVQTDIGIKHNNWLFALAWRIRRNMKGNKTPAEGAATPVFLATSEEVAGQDAKYWDNCRPKRSSKLSYDQALSARLWEDSLAMCGIEDYFWENSTKSEVGRGKSEA